MPSARPARRPAGPIRCRRTGPPWVVLLAGQGGGGRRRHRRRGRPFATGAAPAAPGVAASPCAGRPRAWNSGSWRPRPTDDPDGLVTAADRGRLPRAPRGRVAAIRRGRVRDRRPRRPRARRSKRASASTRHRPVAPRGPAARRTGCWATCTTCPTGCAMRATCWRRSSPGGPTVRRERLATLRAVLEAPGIGEAADRLGVHRNTVAYRVSRLEAVGGWDLADPELRFALGLAVRLVQDAQIEA